MKAIMTGTIAGGFGITKVVQDDEAEDAVVRLMADGQLAEAMDIENPKTLDKRAKGVDQKGSCFIVYGKGLGNGFSMYGPFKDSEYAEEFAEDNLSEDEEWEIFNRSPRYVHGGWTHIFYDNGPDVDTRIVYDRMEGKLVALEIRGSSRWFKASKAEVADLEDSLKNANEEALDDPATFGLEQSDTSPDWCAAT